MELTIRRATPADATVITDFNARLAWESEQVQLDPVTLAAGVEALLADSAKGFYLLAEQAGAVMGQLLITYEWSDWRNGWFWWIQSVYVQAEARRAGVFRRLFESIQQAACADPQVIGLRLYVDADNQSGLTTYHKLGLRMTNYRLMEIYPLPRS